MIRKLFDDLDNLPLIVKIIIGIIMVTIITTMSFLFIGVAQVHALTPVEANFIYDSNGTQTTYNIKPDGGTTGFIYNNEFFGQEINHSSYRYYKLPGSTFKTTNINGYFQNPCQTNEEMSYTMTINFYKQTNSTNTMAGVNVINGINGCSGYLSQLPDSVVYYNVCTIQPGDVPKFSLYFEESSSGMTTYRVGIPINFSYTCQVGNQAVIDNATANANNIINNVVQATNDVAQRTVEAINSTNEYCSKETIAFNQARYNQTTTDTNGYLASNGNIINNQNWKVSDYIELIANTTYKLSGTTTWLNYPSYCIYNTNEILENCYSYDRTTINKTINYTTDKKIRISYSKEGGFLLLLEGTICKSNTQAIIDAENENWDRWITRKEEIFAMEEEDREQEKGLLQNILSAISNLFSDDVDDPTSDLNSLAGSLTSDTPVSNLLLLPVGLYQSVVNNINGTCNSFNLGTLYGHNLTMSCIRVDSFLGSALYGVIDVIISGLFVFAIRKKFVQIFINLTSLKTGGNELE